MERFCGLGSVEEKFLQDAFVNLGLSMRGYNKVLKVSRTIADLSDSAEIKIPHIAEALQYRSLEKLYRR